MDQLQKQLKDLNENIKKSNSLWRSMLKALLNGVAGAIGASIVAGIIIGFLSLTIRTVHDIPIIGRLLESTHIEQFLKRPPDQH